MAGKGSLRYDIPQSLGRDRSHGHAGREHSRARSGPDHRHRHALLGLHHRLEDRIPESGGAVREYQRGGVRCVQAFGAAGGRRCAGCTGRAGGGPGRLSGIGRVPRARCEVQRRLGPRGGSHLRVASRAADLAGRSSRRGERCIGAARCGGERGGERAGRSAQAVADARPEGLSPRVRILDDGLRDRGRTRDQAGRSVARCMGDGRRRSRT